MASTPSLQFPFSRVPPARPVARDHPLAMQEECTPAITLSMIPTVCATTATHFGSRLHLHR
jgi:hypothetical protein